MSEEEIKNVFINALRILEGNIIQNQFKIAELLALFEEESYSEDGGQHMKRLKK